MNSIKIVIPKLIGILELTLRRFLGSSKDKHNVSTNLGTLKKLLIGDVRAVNIKKLQENVSCSSSKFVLNVGAT
jgi:hypothetical protein